MTGYVAKLVGFLKLKIVVKIMLTRKGTHIVLKF